MAIQIVTADQRLARKPKINVALLGPSGVGKTFQAKTLDPATTLFIDLEAGMLSVQDWPGDSIDVRAEAAKLGVHPWEFARGIACLLSGPDPAAAPMSPYSREMHARYVEAIGDPAMFDKYNTIFIDSITVASRHSFAWSKRQPEAFSEKTGKPDTRGAYGLHGQEMIGWLTQVQHIPEKSIIVVGILETTYDDFKRPVYEMQIEGSKAGRELPGIFDQVITLGLFTVDENGGATLDLEKGTQRAFVTHKANPWGVPAKDRSTCLDIMEPPDLGALLKKIAAGKRNDAVITTGPQTAAAPVDSPAQSQAPAA